MEVVFRALAIYVFLWAVTRAVGRSTLGELSTFQLLLYVTMGDLVQQAVTQQDYSVTAAFLAIGTFAVVTVGISAAQRRWGPVRPLSHGVPIAIVRNGEPDAEALAAEQLSAADLFASAREEGITSLADVELAVLEADGKISFFTRSEEKAGAAERPSTG